jgi:hypothetical protein
MTRLGGGGTPQGTKPSPGADPPRRLLALGGAAFAPLLGGVTVGGESGGAGRAGHHPGAAKVRESQIW